MPDIPSFSYLDLSTGNPKLSTVSPTKSYPHSYAQVWISMLITFKCLNTYLFTSNRDSHWSSTPTTPQTSTFTTTSDFSTAWATRSTPSCSRSSSYRHCFLHCLKGQPGWIKCRPETIPKTPLQFSYKSIKIMRILCLFLASAYYIVQRAL